jgi:hypothetical protein
MGMSADDLQELSKETMGSYVKAKKAAIPYQATAPGIKLAQKKLAKNEEVELDETMDKHFTKQSPKMQDAINLHLRRGKDYAGAVEAAKKHVKEEVELDEGYSLGDAKYPKESEGHAMHDVHYKPMIGAKRKVGHVVAYPIKGGRDIEYASGSNAKNDPHFTSGHKTAEAAFKELKNQKPHQEVKEESELDEGKSKSTLEKHFSGNPQVMFTVPKGKPKPAFTEPKSKSMKEEKQHIEVIDASGQKRKVPVDADKAFAAVAHYRKQPGIKSARIVSETVEVEEAVEVETIKHPIGQRPKGPGWVLKSSGEQTGKDHNVWQRKFKQVGEAAEVCTLGKESTDKTATTVAPTKKFGKPKPTATGEVAEELSDKQKKHIDQNKNGKIDADDFKKLRGEDDDTPPWTGSSKKVPAGYVPSKSHRQKLARSGIPESVETVTEETKDTPHNVTPASADLRNVAVENTVRQIMAQNIDLRQEAKERDFNSRNNK